jgi:hypothetical protein
MAIAANSYGDAREVSALVPRFAGSSGAFDDTTTPQLDQVESIIDQISGLVNTVLQQHGFAVPVSQADAKLALDLFTNEQVAIVVESVDVRGRLGPGSDQPFGPVNFNTILEDTQMFIATNASGFERLGVTRSNDPISGISYRDTDEGGDDTAPIFQRDAFGLIFKDWDT